MKELSIEYREIFDMNRERRKKEGLPDDMVVFGKDIKTDDVDFSFSISDKRRYPKAPTIRIKFSPDAPFKYSEGYFQWHKQEVFSPTGVFCPNPKIKKEIERDVEKEKDLREKLKPVYDFTTKYAVLFIAVHERKLDAENLKDWFCGGLTFGGLKDELLKSYPDDRYAYEHALIDGAEDYEALKRAIEFRDVLYTGIERV